MRGEGGSLVPKLGGAEQEPSPQHTHAGSHGNRVKILDPDLSHLAHNHTRHIVTLMCLMNMDIL